MLSRMSDDQYGHLVYPNWLTRKEWEDMSHSERLDHLVAMLALTEDERVRSVAVQEICYYQSVYDEMSEMMQG